MNIDHSWKVKQVDKSRCACCGVVLLRDERVSGYCFRDFRSIPYLHRMQLREDRRARA